VKTGEDQSDYKKLFLSDEFMIVLLDQGVTTLTTTLRRINSFRYLIFMGNANGVIGYGKGKGHDFEEAMDNALMHCKKNLITVPLDHFHSCPWKLESKFNGVTLEITPNHSFNGWGHPMIAAMLMLTGITHCRFKITYRNIN